MRAQARAELVVYARERLKRQLAASGIRGPELESARDVLDPDVLTIGMARRFNGRTSAQRCCCTTRSALRGRAPTGAAGGRRQCHPRDEEGKRFLQEWVRSIRREDVRLRAVFLADYDVRLAERLVHDVDVRG